MTNAIDETALRIKNWVDDLYPNRTILAGGKKMLEEAIEMTTAETDRERAEEAVDCVIIGLETILTAGYCPSQMIERKMAINESRSWVVKDNGVLKHVQEDDTETTLESLKTDILNGKLSVEDALKHIEMELQNA